MNYSENEVLLTTLSITFEFSPSSTRGFSQLNSLIDRIVQYSIADEDGCTVREYRHSTEVITKMQREESNAKQVESTPNNI